MRAWVGLAPTLQCLRAGLPTCLQPPWPLRVPGPAHSETCKLLRVSKGLDFDFLPLIFIDIVLHSMECWSCDVAYSWFTNQYGPEWVQQKSLRFLFTTLMNVPSIFLCSAFYVKSYLNGHCVYVCIIESEISCRPWSLLYSGWRVAIYSRPTYHFKQWEQVHKLYKYSYTIHSWSPASVILYMT